MSAVMRFQPRINPSLRALLNSMPETPPEEIFADDVLCNLGDDEGDSPGFLYVAHDETGEFVSFIISAPGSESEAAYLTLTSNQASLLGRALL